MIGMDWQLLQPGETTARNALRRKRGWAPFLPLLLLFLSVSFMRATAQTASSATESEETEHVVHALCGKRVALLGESPTHAFGATLEFKVKLVHRLIDECHYDALFVESGIYDYLNLEKQRNSGQKVTDAMISAAIGGLWANEEVHSLVPFLREKVMEGNLTLGGLDDQIGAGSYASRHMASDLVQPLQGDERSRCFAVLQKRLLWQYTPNAPYAPSDKAKILGCLDESEERLAQQDERNLSWAQDDKAMMDSLKRNLSRDFTEDDFTKSDQETKWINDRDRSMYLNFKFLSSRLPKNSKIIIWTATVHAAKSLNGATKFEGRVPFGSYIARDFGDQAFSLGFSAYSGEYRFTHPPVMQLSAAPAFSLEGQAFTHQTSATRYLSYQQLRKRGSIPARLLGTDFESAHWDRVVDGVVIFRQERAPAWIQRTREPN